MVSLTAIADKNLAEVVRSYGRNHYQREEKVNFITLYPFANGLST
ncbi:hypothetical protein [Sporosarcina psychrophila]|nr:hypothetical protein [Sporosarcina psychrophila]